VPYTPAQIAEVAHEANRALQRAHGDPAPSPRWDDAPDWQRESAVAGVRTALDGADPEELHEAWCEHKRATGWTYGETKDPEARTHPCLVPYDELPQHQRDKDDLFAAIVGALDDTPPEPLDLTGRHPGTRHLMRWLTPNPNLSGIASATACFHHSLAETMVRNLPDGPELTAGLRKLLEAKDCLVRAVIDAEATDR